MASLNIRPAAFQRGAHIHTEAGAKHHPAKTFILCSMNNFLTKLTKTEQMLRKRDKFIRL